MQERGEDARQEGRRGIGRETRKAMKRTTIAAATATGNEADGAAVSTDPVARWRANKGRRTFP